MLNEQKRAAAYIRVSTDDQLELSPDSQLKEIKNYAKAHGYTLDEEYIFHDDGISGKNAKRRPGRRRVSAGPGSRQRRFVLPAACSTSPPRGSSASGSGPGHGSPRPCGEGCAGRNPPPAAADRGGCSSRPGIPRGTGCGGSRRSPEAAGPGTRLCRRRCSPFLSYKAPARGSLRAGRRRLT